MRASKKGRSEDATREKGDRLIEATRNQFVVDMELGRIIIEPDSVRFHRGGKGRGRVLLARDSLP